MYIKGHSPKWLAKFKNNTTQITRMASSPGILTQWPWTPLGSFKYVVLGPWVMHSIYSLVVKEHRDFTNLFIIPLLLWRMLHNQIWISLSRYRTAKGKNRIVDKGIEFEQVDRESNWDDQILLNGIILYAFNTVVECARDLPFWRTDGMIIIILLHAGPVEFLYYWLHRALHHHYLYTRYHSHHHSSIVTEPITSVIHPFAEHLAYFALFATPLLTTLATGTTSLMAYIGYFTYIDFMNNMGHCNFELVPKSLFSFFPFLKYLMYTPSFHSLHHTQFRTNYSLFMPIYDYIYGTIEKSTDSVYEKSLKKEEDVPQVVHLTHLATPHAIYHMRIGFAGLAANPLPFTSRWYHWLFYPLTFWVTLFTWVNPRTFVIERNRLYNLTLQTWAIPKYQFQYLMRWQNQFINTLIENAILEADKKGVNVLSLGLLNQGNKLNSYGDVYVRRNPGLKIKIVDGSSLAVAVVVNTIPPGTTQVLIRGTFTKVAYALVLALCQKGMQVGTLHVDEYDKLKRSIGTKLANNLVMLKATSTEVWLVGDGLSEEEQMTAVKGTLFIPFSQFPPKKLRKDCIYHTTPAMATPKSLENVDSCENWLPRRVMSAWRVSGIVHGLEGWEGHECGHSTSNIDKVWEAALHHGFRPLNIKNI